MTTTFDLVCQCASHLTSNHVVLTEKLALIILRRVDEGECNPRSLAVAALQEWMADNVQLKLPLWCLRLRHWLEGQAGQTLNVTGLPNAARPRCVQTP